MDSYSKYRGDLAAIRIACAPPTHNPAAACLPSSFPSLSIFRESDCSHPHRRGLSSFYLPLNWCTPVPSPPLSNHLRIDALAYLTILFMESLSCFPMILKAPPPPGTNIPPAALMPRTYTAFRQRAHLKLLDRWTKEYPAPSYYPYPLRLTPHPFMGRDKFIAGRIHQMGSGKSYLAAYPSWFNENPDTTCPCCASAPEKLEHVVLFCPDKSRERHHLLETVSSLGPDSPVWSDPSLIHALGRFISVTRTSFPIPDPPPALSPSTSPSPPPSTFSND